MLSFLFFIQIMSYDEDDEDEDEDELFLARLVSIFEAICRPVI